ncbi:MAG TPA: nucleotidyltransferase family protein [Egibacteraceae bacterium]|nr:nucleotidyltransferase family protein [Egibacteraceae bacterium]
MSAPVAGLLLAAGAGRRLGGPKALVHIEGESLARRGVRLLASGGCAPVVVVLGAGARQALAHDDLAPARTVVNARWDDGMATSLQAGLDALEDDGVGAVVVALADQPLVGAEAVRRLVGAWREGAAVAVAAYDGAARNPVLLDRAWWRAARKSATGDRGARGLLRARPDLVTLVECGDTGAADDLDTPADLAALGGRFPQEYRHSHVPPTAESGRDS